jgi:hypothetical protein
MEADLDTSTEEEDAFLGDRIQLGAERMSASLLMYL